MLTSVDFCIVLGLCRYLRARYGEMAPLPFSDKINVTALAGTWLAALFTGIGLIAVVSQLSNALGRLLTKQQQLVLRASGNWSSCINEQALPEAGTAENVAPAVSGWFQKYYKEDWDAKLTQADRRTSGTSSWSRIFSQCGILPEDLLKYGGPEALFYPVGSGTPRRPQLSDVRFEDGRLLYGFSGPEFAALLILCGFRPSNFTSKDDSFDVSFLGSLYVAEHGPFTQIAHFDPHLGYKEMIQEKERYVHNVPVRHCINLALGILHSVAPNSQQWIVIPDHLDKIGNDEPYAAWQVCPCADQLNNIRYNLEQLAVRSGAHLIQLSNKIEDVNGHIQAQIETLLATNSKELRISEALLAAEAIVALRTWAILPVAPKHFVKAFKEILEPFVEPRQSTVALLSERLREESVVQAPVGWKNRQELASAVGGLGDIKIDFFSRSSNYCAYFHQGMTVMFRQNRLEVSQVRDALAVAAACHIIELGLSAKLSAPGKKALEAQIRIHLFEAADCKEVPREAIVIYATFLWGWLNDALQIDSHLHGRFRRRVFLG